MYKISKMVWESKMVCASKTVIEKIIAKITTTALLFFLLLFTLTPELKAQAVQENNKSGFFAGFVVLDGFQVDSSKSISEPIVTTSYEVVYYSGATSRIDATGFRNVFSANCEIGATGIRTGTYPISFRSDYFTSFTPGEKSTSAVNSNTLDPDGNAFPTSYCYHYFYGDSAAERNLFTEYEVTADSVMGGALQVSTESDKISGHGLQFGYRGEKWRASFTHYTGQGGDHELTNSLAMVDYFFQEKSFVGAGLASIKLTNSSAEGDSLSASATSPVLQVGYTEKLTKNLQLSIGVLQYSSGLSLSSTTPTTTTPTITVPTETQTAVGDSAIIGAELCCNPDGTTIEFILHSGGRDDRVEVTQVGTRTVHIGKTVTPVGEAETIETELKAPTLISVSLHFSF